MDVAGLRKEAIQAVTMYRKDVDAIVMFTDASAQADVVATYGW